MELSVKKYDVIVIGVGSMGSAACYYLAKQGVKVLGIEQFSITHERGSHTGQTRLIRKAYFEHPDYVPLLMRAYQNWRDIENESSTKLYYETGIAYFGFPGSEIVEGSKRSAKLYNIPFQPRDSRSYSKDLRFHIPPHFESYIEPEAGFLLPDRAIQTYTQQALKHGAEIQTGTRVIEWQYTNKKVRVRTEHGTFESQHLIITAGSWASELIPQVKSRLKVTRQLLAWADLKKTDEFMLGNFPCWFIDDPEYGLFYGFPVLPSHEFGGPAGLKLAHHFPGTQTDPGQVQQEFSWKDESVIRYVLNQYLPEVPYKNLTFKYCLYTHSPDSYFIIDYLPAYDEKVTVACGFSGHGFKFASVVGEILADLALKGSTELPIDFLKLDRFTKKG